MWKFEIYRDRGHQWRWRLKVANGRIVEDSGEGYATEPNARRAAQHARTSISSASVG